TAPERRSRRSIAARIRGWTAEDDVAEQRLKDQVTFRLSVRRRWGTTAVGGILRSGWYRWWQVYALALIDVLLVSVPVAFYGPGGLIVGFYLAVLPYVFNQGGEPRAFLRAPGSLRSLPAA